MMDLVLFGIQGSGKGTQAKKLAADFGYYIFEAGGELRKIAASGSQLGNTVKSFIDEGHLVPFEIIMEVVRQAILAQPVDQQILFDGIPRDNEQMTAFDQIMKDAGRDFVGVQILVDEEQAFNRILGRAKVEGRADDADPEKIRRRMDLFKEKTMPVITRYKSLGKLIEVDGEGTVEEIYARLKLAVI